MSECHGALLDELVGARGHALLGELSDREARDNGPFFVADSAWERVDEPFGDPVWIAIADDAHAHISAAVLPGPMEEVPNMIADGIRSAGGRGLVLDRDDLGSALLHLLDELCIEPFMGLLCHGVTERSPSNFGIEGVRVLG